MPRTAPAREISYLRDCLTPHNVFSQQMKYSHAIEGQICIYIFLLAVKTLLFYKSFIQFFNEMYFILVKRKRVKKVA